jgi:hypothetical protein
VDEVQIRVFEKPQPDFTYTSGCEGSATHFEDASVLVNPIAGQAIVLRE